MSFTQIELPVKPPRRFLPENLSIDSWKKIKPFYDELKSRPVSTVGDLKNWLMDASEMEAVLQEDAGWRYIRMSCNTADHHLSEAFNFFITQLQPRFAPYEHELHKKLLSSPFLGELPDEYKIFIRHIRREVELFRSENIPLFTELHTEEQKYAALVAEMTVEMEGKEMTLPQAGNYLKDTNRSRREEVYSKIAARRMQDRDKLDELYSALVRIRNKVALNAGFRDYRDYMFSALGRFDYTVQDCINFQDAISEVIVPVIENLEIQRKKTLGLDSLKPWDLEVDVSGKPSLKPFSGVDELMDKTIICFENIDPMLGEYMQIMKAMKHVDLESRKGKAPGGFNYPLYETGVPFVFVNAANSLRDLVTMVHEGGHAVHSLLTREMEIVGFKDTPSEVAELASMSMELISMEHWDVFFSNPDDLKRARRQQLEKVLNVFPWVATIDKFQHWVYTHPEHSAEERTLAWKKIYGEFAGKEVDWTGHQDSFDAAWQKQLHLYQVPFYYIEYGMAQLGAIAVWRNYKENPRKGLENYLNALRLGYTRSIGEIYRTAGIRFDFSKEYVNELTQFVLGEIEKL